MDDLIEGLIHTMLDDTRPHQVERSSWAEVVGGHGDDNGECPTQSESSRLTANHGGDRGKRHQFKQSHSDYDWQEQDHRRQQVAVDSVCHGEDTDGWHTVGAHHHKTPKKYCKFYFEEAKGRIDYQGYIFPRRRGQVPDSETQLLTIQFTWNGILKSLSSTLVGVSPEFEIALYTLCFYAGRNDNHIELGPYNVNIKCYRLEGDKIGSIFPIAQD